MPTSHESTRSDDLIELREWYLESLLPKLARAAETGIVDPAGAAELERRFSELFGPLRTRTEAA
jgi:hypothetical protein